MSKIHILPEQLANQIAAGEVVERPASVVKELVENSLDAGSCKIKITLAEGGLTSIRVRDNGTGMARSDLERAFMRHATSKIATDKDLFNIRSLGFRGEALPSIAAVSIVQCRTRSQKEKIGTEGMWKGGQLETIQEIAHAEGTDTTVNHLFYNTPARLKYLKTINTEISHVTDVVNRLALAYPSVSFVLKHEERTLLHTLGDGRLLHVIQAIYGQTVARAMLSLEGEHADFELNGYIGKPEVTRASRHYISVLVNGRYVRSYRLTQAVLDAYQTLLPINRKPVVVLSLQMDPKLVDVNVHPAKLEVRFSKEKELITWLKEVIRERLMAESLIPQLRFQTKQKQPTHEQAKLDFHVNEIKESGQAYIHQKSRFENPEVYRDTPGYRATEDETAQRVPVSPVTSDKRKKTASPIKETKDESVYAHRIVSEQRLPDLVPLAQVHGTYIVAQSVESLFLIDQHAAHERIYYEYFRRQFEGVECDQQELLFPITIELTAEEGERLLEKQSILQQTGITLETFGPQSYIVRSHPTWFPKGAEEALIRELVDWVLMHDRLSLADLRDETAKQMACQAAIKANRHLRIDEMQSLLTDLQGVSNPFTCPHGRPILIEFTSYELEKMFKRVM